ncbi:MAG: hypothetical protein ABW133_09055 [Polyangiaceae bacterium]
MSQKPSPDDLAREKPNTAEKPRRGARASVRAPAPPVEMLLGGLVTRKVRVPAREVVFVKGVIEASEGVAAVFADHGGDLTIATLPTQKDELDRILQDLAAETGALFEVAHVEDGAEVSEVTSVASAPHRT